MFIDALLASFIAFGLAVLLMELTRNKRLQSKAIHYAVLVFALGLSVFLAANTSISPEASGGYLFYFWVGYAIFNLVFRRRKTQEVSVRESEESP